LRFLRVLALPFLIPGIVCMCIGHYRNHTAEWMEARGYQSEEEIVVRIFRGVWDWVMA
jgi:hypothetical protein